MAGISRPHIPFALGLLGACSALALGALSAGAVPEVEPNDVASNATVIPLNTSVTGSYNSSDADWFEVSAPSAGLFNVTLPGFYWSPALVYYASNGTLAPAWSEPWANGHELDLVLYQAEVLHVKLGPSYGNTESYAMFANFTPDFAEIEGADEVEPNSDADHAQPVTLGPSYSARVSPRYKYDMDYWLLNATEPGLLRVEFSTNAPAVDFFEPDGVTPVYIGYGLGLVVDQPTVLIMRVNAWGYGAYDYSFFVFFTTSFASITGPDEVEPNNRPENATPFPPSENASGVLDYVYSDADYWLYEVPGAGLVTVDSQAPIYVSTERVDGASVGRVGMFWTGSVFRFGFIANGTANVTIAISTGTSGLVNYSLRVQFVAGFSSIQGSGEVEQNGDPANASALPLSTRTEGRLDSTYADVDWWRLSVPGAGLLRLAVSDCCGGPIAGALLNATDLAPTAAVGVYTGPGLGGLSLVVDGPTDFYFVAQELYYAAHTYTMNATFEAGFAHLQGPDEIEPNDRIQDALALAQGVAVRGLAEGTFGDHDFWSIALAGGGYGFLNLVSDAVWCSVEVTDAGGKPLASSSSYGDPISLNFAVPPAGPAYIDVSSVSGPCAYSLDAKWGLSQSIVSEGAGEREPNDAAEQGTVISATGSYAGRLKPTYDTVDFFRVEPVSGAVVRVEVSAPAGFGAPPRFAWVDGAGLARSAWSGPRDLPYRTDLLLHPGEPFVFSIALGGWDSDYLLNVTVTPTDIFADGSANLAELASLAIGFHIESLGSGGSPGENFTFAAGERSSYGLWLCGRSSLDNTVPGVLVERGRLLIPEGPGPTMVARAEGEGEVTGEFGPCFEVLARDTQELGLASWVYAVGGFLEGDALKVLAAAEGSFQSQGSVLLALWAVTSIPTLAELEAWEVEPLAVDAANGLLERAGVTQRLPIPRAPVEQPPPPPPGNITVAARTPLGLSGAIALGALAGGGTAAALIAGAVANSRLSRPTAPAEAPRCGQCGRPARPGFVSCPECRAPYRWR